MTNGEQQLIDAGFELQERNEVYGFEEWFHTAENYTIILEKDDIALKSDCEYVETTIEQLEAIQIRVQELNEKERTE